jgi:transcription initiation factor TFIID TATA-box-binding protein
MKRTPVNYGEIQIANVVATVTLSAPLDLSMIHERLPETQFPKNSSWLKLRLKPDNTYTSFYKSGKFLITTKNPEKINPIALQILEILHGVGIDLNIVRTEIHNIVVITKIPLDKSLESLIVNLDPKKASFEPEQFPAIIYKDWGISFLLFSSGSCVVTGLKEFCDAERVIGQLKELMKE